MSWTPWSLTTQTPDSGLATFGMVSYNRANEEETLEVTFYEGELDGKPVVQVDGGGDFRVNINDGVVFDRHTESESLIYKAALALYHVEVQFEDDRRHFSQYQMAGLRNELVEAGFSSELVDSCGKLKEPYCLVCDAHTTTNDDGICAVCEKQEQGAPQ